MNRRIAYLAGIAAVVASLALALSPLAHRADSTVAQTTNVRAAANRPSTTQPAAAAQSTDRFILPEEFAILQTHNPFGRGHGRTRGGGPESMFVFKGAVEAGNTFTALIEDLAAKRVMQAVVGDTVARGKITSINLDAVVYAAPGTTRRIAVGQDLEGRDVPPDSATGNSAIGAEF